MYRATARRPATAPAKAPRQTPIAAVPGSVAAPAGAPIDARADAHAPLARMLRTAVLQRDGPRRRGFQEQRQDATGGARLGSDRRERVAPGAARRMRRDRALFDVGPLVHELDVLYRELGMYGDEALAENRRKVRFKAVASLAMAGADIGTAGASGVVTVPMGVMLELIQTEDHAASELVSTPFRSAQEARAGTAAQAPAAAGGMSGWERAGWAAKGIDIGLKAVELPAHVPGASKSLGVVKNLVTLYKSGRPFTLDEGNREYVRLAMRDLDRLRGKLAAKERQLRGLRDRRVAGVVDYLRFELPVVDELLKDLRGLVAASMPALEKAAAEVPAAPAAGHRRRNAVYFHPAPQTRPRR